MGKKRRLSSAKAKFATKHSAHPRARLLAAAADTTENVEATPVVETKVEATPTPVAVETVTPEVEVKTVSPKKTTTTKRPPPKKKATAPRKSKSKKTTSTEKRA